MFNLTEEVRYSVYNNIYVIKRVLREIAQTKPIIALDFETIPKYTKEDKDQMSLLFDSNKDISLLPKINSNGLSHPSLIDISHLSVAWSKNDAVVIICDTEEIRHTIFDWLITIDNLQIWSNFSYDGKIIYHYTNKFPKRYEDVQLIHKARVNHCEPHKALVGLKESMGHMYGDWGIDKTEFTIEHMYTDKMLKYSATDSCATYAKFINLNYNTELKPRVTNPIDLLPLKAHPINGEPKEEDYFYRNVIKALIPMFIKLALTGIPISLDKVQELEPKIDKVLEEADNTFNNSKIIKKYLNVKHKAEIKEKKKEVLGKKKTYQDCITEFKPNNKVHRNFIINTYLKDKGLDKYLLDDWNIKDLKQLCLVVPNVFLQLFIDKDYINPIVKQHIDKGMVELAKHKANIYNNNLEDKANNLTHDIRFNPNSSVQKKELLWDFLEIESDTISNRTNNYSYNRAELERILIEINHKLEE
jgi:hypothetical protein